MISGKFNKVIKSINLILKDTTLRLDKLVNDSIEDNDLVLGFIQKNRTDGCECYSIEVSFEIKPVIKNNCISLDIKYEYDNIGDAGCDATPEFLDDNGINSIKLGVLITDLSDIDGALA